MFGFRVEGKGLVRLCREGMKGFGITRTCWVPLLWGPYNRDSGFEHSAQIRDWELPEMADRSLKGSV